MLSCWVKVHDLPEDQKACPCCGQLRRRIGQETSWQIEYLPAHFRRIHREPRRRDGIAAECQANIETVIFADVDIEMLRRHRRKGTVLNWADRRTDLYRIRYGADGDQRDV